jgi:hypothetical protein
VPAGRAAAQAERGGSACVAAASAPEPRGHSDDSGFSDFVYTVCIYIWRKCNNKAMDLVESRLSSLESRLESRSTPPPPPPRRRLARRSPACEDGSIKHRRDTGTTDRPGQPDHQHWIKRGSKWKPVQWLVAVVEVALKLTRDYRQGSWHHAS